MSNTYLRYDVIRNSNFICGYMTYSGYMKNIDGAIALIANYIGLYLSTHNFLHILKQYIWNHVDQLSLNMKSDQKSDL